MDQLATALLQRLEQLVALLKAIGADDERRQIVNLRLLAKAFEVRQVSLRILVQLAFLADRGFRLINPESDTPKGRRHQTITPAHWNLQVKVSGSRCAK